MWHVPPNSICAGGGRQCVGVDGEDGDERSAPPQPGTARELLPRPPTRCIRT
jgi:hypothetical protein